MARGWKGNALGLQKWEVECAHKARLDATEAVAHLMRQGKTFADAKADVIRRARSAYKFSRPELNRGYMLMVNDVQFTDMPRDIFRKIEDDFRADIEKQRGKPLGWFDRALFKWFGVVW